MSSPAPGSPHDAASAPEPADHTAATDSSRAKGSRRLRPGLWAVGGCLLLTVLLRGGLWPASGNASVSEQGLISVAGSVPTSAETSQPGPLNSSAASAPADNSSNGAAPAGDAPQPAAGSDEQYRSRIIGLWEQENHGHRTLDVRADGTALMVVQPEPAWQILFGERLEFDVRWAVRNGRLETTVVAARPGATARAARQMYGDHHVSPILVLNDTLMRLNDEEGEEHTPWHRSAAAVQPQDSAK